MHSAIPPAPASQSIIATRTMKRKQITPYRRREKPPCPRILLTLFQMGETGQTGVCKEFFPSYSKLHHKTSHSLFLLLSLVNYFGGNR